jgi:diacylglycerol kinase (ATP)
VVLIALAVTLLVAIALKAYVGRGTPLRGGFPSGHAAAAFAAWMAITLVVAPWTHAALISTLAFLMALLVAQSRVEAGIHSVVEVVAGAVLGAGVTLLLFQIWG